MRKSGEHIFCEPWHEERIVYGEVPVSTTAPAEIIAIANTRVPRSRTLQMK